MHIIDAAYCYRPRGVVCVSLCVLGTSVSPVKTAKLLQKPFNRQAGVGPRNHVWGAL